MKIDDIITSLEMTLKLVEKKLQEIKEIDRSDPKHFESQKAYEKLLEGLQYQLNDSISQLKRFSCR